MKQLLLVLAASVALMAQQGPGPNQGPGPGNNPDCPNGGTPKRDGTGPGAGRGQCDGTHDGSGQCDTFIFATEFERLFHVEKSRRNQTF